MNALEDNNELLQGLLRALDTKSARDAYRTLRFVLTRLVDLSLRDLPLQFSGLFAKTSYLLKEHKADAKLVRAVGNARQRIRHLDELDDEALQKCFPYDLKSITALLHLLHPEIDIPSRLKDNLPQGYIDGGWKKASADCLRIIVDSWDDTVIHGRADEGDMPELTVCYGQANKYLQYDYSYLTPLLSIGAQLNLIHPRQEEGLTYPEMIILEPDFLVDISSLAAMFQEYGVTPLTALIKKIAPSAQTRYTLFGDFASQLLDEELHGQHDRPYKESISDFCQSHALAMAACDDLGADFHKDALVQKTHIHKAFSQDLPQTVADFSPEEVVLEPSFTCEMLGLQGRIDFLQRDCHILIEQKSGKADFVPGERGFVTPHKTTPHFVQLLLYRALLHYNYNIPNNQIRPFLLYSKYEQSLLHTDSAPELLYRAFRLRNQLVWSELQYNIHGFGLLKTLKAEDLNINHTSSRLWTNYTSVDINRTLAPLHTATPLEMAYHQAMMQFVQREFILSKIGNKRKENSGAAARWHDSLEEKKEAGNIIDNLTISATNTHVVCDNADLSASNFRTGDIVTLFPYRRGTEPDCRKTMVHRASIEKIDADSITLKLRVPQTNAKVFDTPPDFSWAMEHDFMDSSFASQFRAVHAFLSASARRRSLILTQREPEVDTSKTLNGDYKQFNTLSLRVKQACELFLIVGPPGTGKTSFGMLNTLKEELTNEDSSVAVMAYTNRAVDEICSKLAEEGIDFVRIGNEASCSEVYRPYLLDNKVAGIVKIDAIKDFVRRQRIFVGTTTAFNSRQSIFALRSFSLAIIDEASQILEPQLLGLLSARHGDGEAIGKFVMIGDHKQLPAVVQQEQAESTTDDPLLHEIGLYDCRLSLFERLLRRYGDNPQVVYMLHSQGRMHEDIVAFPSHEFYEGMLSCVPLPHQTEPSTVSRVQFIDVHPDEITSSDKVNTSEAEVIASLVESIGDSMSIGIIVPYRSQISAVRNAIHRRLHSDPDITIDTVERFQGSQREAIIYGFTVQRHYQLDFLTDNCFCENGKTIDRKLNVVMTRAMKQLYLVGNARLLSTVPLYRKLIDTYII